MGRKVNTAADVLSNLIVSFGEYLGVSKTTMRNEYPKARAIAGDDRLKADVIGHDMGRKVSPTKAAELWRDNLAPFLPAIQAAIDAGHITLIFDDGSNQLDSFVGAIARTEQPGTQVSKAARWGKKKATENTPTS